MGDVISSHLDEGKREIITARTGEVMGELGRLYEQQYAVALFNNVRFDIEGGGGPQPQLLHRKTPLENKSIFSGALFQYLEENKKWRNRFLFVPDSYNINFYDNKASHDRGLHPKGTINCAGYKVLTSMEPYLELISNSLPGVKAKVGNAPFLKCATQFPVILWHPYGRHYYFCLVTEKEQQKWHAVFQDCVRHANDGLSEENKVQTPAFTDAVRLYRQAHSQYGTWDMMCGVPPQILSNLVMESLLPELRDLISPRLKGKMHERQRNWMLISDAVYSLVQRQCEAQYEAVVQRCEAGRPLLEASIRTDMDQIITSKEHVTNKIRAAVLPKAEKLLMVSIQPYISSILDALMEPTSRGFFEVRDVFFRELVDMSKNTLNDGSKETVAEHMEKISMLAFHPVKMQSCYEKVEQLSLEGLQQRFDVSSPSVFVQRAQILMREQMDDAVYTFEQILHQSLEGQGTEGLCKIIQRCQDRVIKKFDYDSSTVRKRFFREALLQIFIPYMLKQLTPSCASELPRFQELIFEDFSRFILVENIFEEVVLHSVMKDIMMAVKEAAVQRRHNLYRDSIVLNNSDPNLHLLGEKPSVDWAGEYGTQEEADGAEEDMEEGEEAQKRRRMKQVVSMIQVEGSPVLPNESCMEVPRVDGIPEEKGGGEEEEEAAVAGSSPDSQDSKPTQTQNGGTTTSSKTLENPPALTNGSVPKEGDADPEARSKVAPSVVAVAQEADTPKDSPAQDPESSSAVESVIQEIENAVEGEDSQTVTEGAAKEQAPPSNQEVTAQTEELMAPTVEVTAQTEEVSTPAGEVTILTEEVVAPKEEVMALTEEVTAPTEQVTTPTEEVSALAREATTLTEEVTAPIEEVTAPKEEVTAPTEEVAAPIEEVTASTGEVTVPTGEVTVPTGEVTAPTGEVTVPTGEVTAPTGEVTAPTREVAALTGEVTAPTGELTAPTEEVTAPTGEVAAPTGEVTAPTGEVTAPTEELTAPTGEVTAPTGEVTAPTEEVMALVEEVSPPPPVQEEASPSSPTDTQHSPTSDQENPVEAGSEAEQVKVDCPPPPHDDSGFQSPTSEEEETATPSVEVLQPGEGTEATAAPVTETTTIPNDSETGEKDSSEEAVASEN